MVLDTNILIAYLNGESVVVGQLSGWKQEGRVLFVSSIAVAEVLALHTLAPDDVVQVKRFLNQLVSVPFDDDLAELAAFCRRTYRIGLQDCAIAATALRLRVPLVTRDKQFYKIKEITVIEI